MFNDSDVRPSDSTVPSSSISGFRHLGLLPLLERALEDEGYSVPTPIQERAVPPVLQGRDVVGVAQTGTGKTAAFALPILQRLVETPRRDAGAPRVLVLAPTRELAAQIGDGFGAYGRYTLLRHTVVFGGVGQNPQVHAIRSGVDVLVATPGRLLDLLQQRLVKLDRVEILVLDEADRMLDMGFLPDVRRVVAAVPKQRQTLLFSATMPADIQDLVRSMLRDPVKVEVTPAATTATLVEQSVHLVEKEQKRALLELVLRAPEVERALVFTRTKHGANRVAEQLARAGIRAEAIHGNKSQNARERALAGFKAGTIPVLVATDIAARGIDVDGVTHVVNFDLPNVAETYVHRIGRTARAGATGIAVSFCDREERPFLADIERLIRRTIPRASADIQASLPPVVREATGSPRADAFRGDSWRGDSSRGRPTNGSPRGRAPQPARAPRALDARGGPVHAPMTTPRHPAAVPLAAAVTPVSSGASPGVASPASPAAPPVPTIAGSGWGAPRTDRVPTWPSMRRRKRTY